MQDYAEEPSISATCADDAHRSFENLEELFEYENPINSRITSLDMDSYGAGMKKETSANIEFKSATGIWSIPAIYIRVSGTEEPAFLAMRKLNGVVAGSRPWHSRISKRNMPPFGQIGWAIFGMLMLFMAAALIPVPTLIEWRVQAAYVGFLTVMLFWALALIASNMTKFLFPPAVFLIGQEKERHATKQWQQKLALGALVTGGVAILTWLLSMS